MPFNHFFKGELLIQQTTLSGFEESSCWNQVKKKIEVEETGWTLMMMDLSPCFIMLPVVLDCKASVFCVWGCGFWIRCICLVLTLTGCGPVIKLASLVIGDFTDYGLVSFGTLCWYFNDPKWSSKLALEYTDQRKNALIFKGCIMMDSRAIEDDYVVWIQICLLP